jgi:hypothetical protein
VCSVSTSQESISDASLSRDSFEIMDGTEYETTVYETTASEDGGTVVVFGGVHGNEVAGYEAADLLTEWDIEAGTLVVIPEADAPAVEAGTRSGPDGQDLNRQFPADETPTSDLARAIWDVVVEYDPDVVIDLHESTGIYAGDPVDGVGQAIFHSDTDRATRDAQQAVEYVNQNYVEDTQQPFLASTLSPDTNQTDLLVHKAWLDLDTDAYLVETLSRGPDIETRLDWQLKAVGELVEDELFPNGVDEPEEDPAGDDPEDDESDEDPEADEPEDDPAGDDPEDDESDEDGAGGPTAVIETTPMEADQIELRDCEVVTLDARDSSGGDDEIDRYQWDIDGDGQFDHEGEAIDITIAANGDYPVTLCVVDEGGRIAYDELVLSTE